MMNQNAEEDFLTASLQEFLNSPAYKQAVEESIAQMREEEAVIEAAPWFGVTGLGDDIERELPRYLRREFGESVFEPNALKAEDLIYLGAFDEDDSQNHFWRISTEQEEVYAYISVGPEHTLMGWGDRAPPPQES